MNSYESIDNDWKKAQGFFSPVQSLSEIRYLLSGSV